MKSFHEDKIAPKLICLMAVMLLCVATTVRGQLPPVRNFSPKDYGGGTQNWGLALNAYGSLLVANNDGLMVYTGQQWTIAPVPNHSNVHAIEVDSVSGRFYVGAFGEFGYFKSRSPLNERDYVSLSARLSVAQKDFEDIWRIERTAGGEIVFSSSHHLFVYSPHSDSLEFVSSEEEICNVSVVGASTYVSTDCRIYILRGTRLEPLRGSESVAEHRVAGAFGDGNNVVFATRDDGFYVLGGKGGEIRPHIYPALSKALEGSRIFCTASNDVWIVAGTISDGLYALHRRDGRLYHLDRSNGLRNNTVLSLLIDGDSNIWAGLDNGLSYIIFDTAFRPLFADGEVGTGYASAVYDGRLYLGTNQSLFCMPVPDAKGIYTLKPEAVDGIGGQIWTLSECGGRLLCGANAGAYEIEGTRAIPIDGLGPTWGFKMYGRNDSVAIAATYTGFAVLDLTPGGWKVRNHVEGTDQSSVNFETDGEGRIWYSHWLKGVYCLELNEGLSACVAQHLYNGTNQLPGDDNNLIVRIGDSVYVSAADGFYFADDHHRLHSVAWLGEIFPAEGVGSRLMPTRDGNLWAYVPGKLSYAIRDEDGRYRVGRMHNTSMVERLQMNLGNISDFEGGYTLMNYDDGFYLVDPSAKVADPRRVVIDYVREGSVGDDTTDLLYLSGQKDSGFETKAGCRSLTFYWSYPEYREEGAILFTSFIEGYDSDWTEPSVDGDRDVSHISPGDYVLKVKAINTVTGHETMTEQRFSIKPAWYATWWARLMAVLVAIVVNYLLIRIILRLISRRIALRRHRQQEKERERLERERLEEEKTRALEHNEKLSREIKYKSSELADSDLHNIRNSTTLKNIDQAIGEILAKAAAGVDRDVLVSEIRGLSRSIRIHSVEEASLDRLTDNFNIIFDDLLKRLVSRYPGLTRNDIALCSYLKLNLSTKQIASVMNLSERSVESNRYRLRKKLGMDAGESFTAFFSRFDRTMAP